MTMAALRKPLTIRARTAVAAAAVLSAIALGSVPVSAARGVDQAVTGPPAWVVAGTRITHYWSTATLPAGVYALVEDPNGPLVDPATGKHYRESYTASTTGQPAPTPSTTSGDGFAEVTVAAVEGTEVVLAHSTIHNDALSGTRYLAPSSNERVAGANVPLAWIRPDLLATMKTGDVQNQLVLRGQVTVGGQTYEAINLVLPLAGNYSLLAYDSVTGVLLQSALRMSDPNGGPLQMYLRELRGVRQLAIPGLGAAAPDWLARRPQLTYAGTRELLVPPGQPISTPETWQTTFTQTGATWAMFQTTITYTGLGPSASYTTSGVTSGSGLFWWDPTALAAMTAGQVLDTDAHTGQTITASQIVQEATGPAVVIVVAMPGYQVEARYDVATGVMTAHTEVSTTMFGTTTTRLTLQQMP